MPHLSVIFHDTFSYAIGFMLGKTPLIMLAPRKTWEGFIGGLVFNLILTYYVSEWLAGFSYLTCSQESLTTSIFSSLTCETREVFKNHTYDAFGFGKFSMRGSTLHSLATALFASAFCPFVGYLMNGIKRAFRI